MLIVGRGVALLAVPLLLLGCGEVARDRDTGPADSALADKKVDRGKGDLTKADTVGPDALQADLEVKDTGSDAVGPPAKAAFSWGGLISGGPASPTVISGNTVLVAGGFESLSTVCATTKSICVTGGVLP